MTLIAAILEPGHPTFLISDIALSGVSTPILTTQLPMQMGLNHTYINADENTNGYISGLAQKMVVFGPHAILWSGGYLEARSLIRFLRENAAILNETTFANLVSEWYDEREIGLSLIYGHSKPNKLTSISTFNCETRAYDNRVIYAAGSGATRFIHEYDRENKEHNLITTFQETSSRLICMYEKEIEDPNAYAYKFGVAYEVGTTLNEEWVKTPYCFSIFGHSKDHFGLKKIIFTYYHRETLIVTTSLFENQANTTDESKWIYLPKNFNWKANFLNFIDSDQAANESTKKILDDFMIDAEVSKQEPVFSITLVERHSNNNNGEILFGRISNFPAVIGVVLKKDGFHLASRAFFRRDVEQHFLGRKFIPPKEHAAFYEKNRSDWAAGEKLSYGPKSPCSTEVSK